MFKFNKCDNQNLVEMLKENVDKIVKRLRGFTIPIGTQAYNVIQGVK